MKKLTKLLDAAGRLSDHIHRMNKEARGYLFRILTLVVIAIAYVSIAVVAIA